ncbi:DNA polymerase V [Oscillibacter sp. PC13]|uniref:Y-family DNA polymerase n=1 Tax=Oscillibacter sp. PC13 TaxID=1855299 RepID=UPI0008F45338|nr:DNA methylase [Oscillibacter sp. PC13]SFP41311.1 DNA polymerase V [Oscillibacter sp. PC13]
MKQKTYIAIDLKSFYASVECRERGLDPLDTNLVVADESRTDKTICLAVTPSLKSYGISGRGRLFEVKQRVKEANAGRQHDAPGRKLEGASYSFSELQAKPELAIDFIIAPPRMAYYMEYSTRIYEIYMKYVAPEDIVVYSIDEVFMDVTDYLNTYKLSPHDLAMKIILDVLETTGITATAGIGTNLFLCKVAMDIVAKHIPADKNGVRIAELDEMKYRRELWSHQPLTDFWRVGRGYAKKLEENGMFTMGDVARMSEKNEDLLYKLFGKNAELLIDHAWGWEPTTIEAIKAYRPSTNSLGSGQVLHCPYDTDKAKLVLREMADMLVLDLVDKGLVTDQIVITIGYDIENLTDPERSRKYHGPVVKDHYGRAIPKHAHGTANLDSYTSSTRKIMCAVSDLFDRIVDKNLLVRRLNIVANHVLPEADAPKKNEGFEQLDLFTDYAARDAKQEKERAELEREKKMQQAMLTIKKKFGKNAILKGMNLEDGATAKDRNEQIGGHKA